MRTKRMVFITLVGMLLAGVLFAEAPAKTDFSGVVVDTAGKAVADASVSLYLLTADMETMSYACQLVTEAASDADGKFSFKVDTPDTKGSTVYCCLAQKKGLSCGWVTAYESNSANWTITLEEPTKLIGFVRNADGTAVENAEVRLVMLSIPGQQMQFMFGMDPVDAFATKTCSEGRFEFSNLPSDATVEFLVRKTGKAIFHTLSESLDPESGLTYKPGQTDIMLTMVDACQVKATVVTQENQHGVGGVKVMIRDTKVPVNLFYEPAVSTDDGTVTFGDLSPGDYMLTALDNDWIAQPVTVTALADKTAEATIELTKGGSVEVTVVEAGSKEPVSGVYVNLRCDETQQYQQMTTDEKGVAKKQLLAGTYRASTYKQGYRSTQEAGTVVVENGKTATLTVELPDQPKLKIQISDAEGKPVQGATARIFPGGGMGQKAAPASDEKGQLILPWDPGQASWAEGEFYLLAMHPDKGLAGVVQIAEDAKEATVKLEKAVKVKGRVVNAAGEPIVGARAWMMFRGSRFSSTIDQGVKTDANGEYSFDALAAQQKYQLRISDAKGYGTGNAEIEPGKDYDRTLEDIVLPIADQKVTGQVVDVDGKGLAGVNLHCYGNSDSGQPNVNTKTDDEGNFVLENVCPGQINISASKQIDGSYQSGYVRTEGGAEDVTIVLSSQNSGSKFVPKKAASLVGKPLELAGCGVEVPADAGRVLVFAWDMNQRPSRHFIKQLTAQAEMLKAKNVTVLLVQAAPVEKAKLNAWLTENKIAWPCGIMAEKANETQFKLGIQGLPWLILTDAEHKVVAEGFSVKELEEKLESR